MRLIKELKDGDTCYVHQFIVSSGKVHKLITKVYFEQEEAEEKRLLLGGFLSECVCLSSS